MVPSHGGQYVVSSSNRSRTLFATAVYTGLRRGELCGLRWSDVNLEQPAIVVRRSHAGATKSGKGRVGHSTPTITGEVYSHLAPSHLVEGVGPGYVLLPQSQRWRACCRWATADRLNRVPRLASIRAICVLAG